MMQKKLAYILAATLSLAVFGGIPAVLADGGNDDIPDPVEQAICGSATIAARVKEAGLGECQDSGHFEPSDNIKKILGGGEAGQQYADDLQDDSEGPDQDTCTFLAYWVDEDACDDIPDDPTGDAEKTSKALLCAAVNETDGAAGTCDDNNDYTPPPVDDVDAQALLCTIVNETDGAAGTCDDNNDYTPPPVDDVDAQALLCMIVNETDGAAGTCDDNNDYTPPPVDDVDAQALLCTIVNETDGAAGTCDDNNDYTPPPVDDVDAEALLCQMVYAVNNTTSDGAAGSCDEDNVYTAPDGDASEAKALLCEVVVTVNTAIAPYTIGSCDEDDEFTPDPGGPIPTPDPDQVQKAVFEAIPGNCRGATDVQSFVDWLLSDVDCDNHSNGRELQEGCDPLDDGDNPETGCEGSSPPPTDSPNDCVDPSDPTNPDVRTSDFDCDNHSNGREIEDGGNPLVSDD